MDRFSSSQTTETPPDTSARTGRTWLREALIVAAVCAIAFAFRIILLGKLSFWIDEIISVIAAKGLVEHGAPILPSGNIYQRSFAHVWVLAQVFKLLGVSEFSARLPSVFFGVASIAVTYYIAKLLDFKRAGLITIFVLAFSPWAIWFSREARMYALFQLVYLLALYFLWLGFERRSNNSRPAGFRAQDAMFLFLAAILFVVGAFTHELMALFPFIFWLYAVVAYLLAAREVGWVRALKGKYGVVAVGGALLGVVIFALLVASGKVILTSHIFGDVVAKVIPGHLTRVWYYAMAKRFVVNEPFLTAMAFFATIVLIMSKKKNAIYLLLSFWIPAITITVLKIQLARYLYFVYPSFVLIAAIGIVYLLNLIVGPQDIDRFLSRARTSFPVKAALVIVVLTLSFAEIREIKSQPAGRVPTSDFMVAYYPNWRLAGKIDTRGKKIVAVDPAGAYYYWGRVDYYVSLTGAEKQNLETSEKIDTYVGSHYLRTFAQLKSVLEKNDCVFVSHIDLRKLKLTDEARDYIWKNLKFENRYSDDSIFVFTTKKVPVGVGATHSAVHSGVGN